jgi:hypothetical protein
MVAPGAFGQSKGGRWQFENDGADRADWDELENDGGFFGNAVFANAPPLLEGQSYLFLDPDSSHDFFLVEDGDDLDFVNENIGISMWVFPIELDEVHYLINKGDQFPIPKTTNYSLRIATNGKLEFLIRDANDQAHRVTSSFVIPVNEWSFLAAFYDFGSKKVYFWNDPASAPDTLDFDQELLGNDNPLAIGSWFRSDTSSPSIRDFEGRIDDVRISGRLEDILTDNVSSVAYDRAGNVPGEFSLFQNYPNPFNPKTVISISITTGGYYRLDIYNARGQKADEGFSDYLQPNVYRYAVDASTWSAGLYYYRLSSGTSEKTRKMVLLK